MQRDADLTFGDIHGDFATLISRITQCQTQTLYAEQENDAASDLRFLCTPPNWILADSEPPTVIRLADRGENIGVSDYVAISYCWGSHSGAGVSAHRFSISTANGERRPRCPNMVLYRAIKFAQGRNIPFIWIDQECIEQDDTSDKERYLQVMHKIYSRSRFTAGLLSFPSITLRQIMSILYLEEHSLLIEDHTNSPRDRLPEDCDSTTILEIQRLLRAISRDRWFTRTWILQEKIAAMKQLILLLPGPPTQLPGWTHSEIEFMPGKAMGTAYYLKSQFSLIDPQTASSIDLLLGQLHSMFGFDVLVESIVEPLQSTVYLDMSESSAFKAMESCDNAIVPDRIAIYANIFHFPKRLDSRLLSTHGFTSFSTAFLALLLHNGRIPMVIASHTYDSPSKAAHTGPILPISATLAELMDGIMRLEDVEDTEDRREVDAQLIRYGVITTPFFNPESRFVCYGGDFAWRIDFIKTYFRESDAPRWDPIRFNLLVEQLNLGRILGIEE